MKRSPHVSFISFEVGRALSARRVQEVRNCRARRSLQRGVSRLKHRARSPSGCNVASPLSREGWEEERGVVRKANFPGGEKEEEEEEGRGVQKV